VTTAQEPVVQVGDLAVAAGGRRLLAPSSFTLYEGERVLLVGPSGSGKSLLVDLLLGFAGPETAGLEVTGSIRIDGRETLGLPPEQRRDAIGAVFQVHAPGLFDDLTVAQNLRFGKREARAIAEAGKRFGLEPIRRRSVDCSGGERVRVVLARTVLRGAEIVVYDEPTAGLDAGAIRRVTDAIGDAHRRLSLVVTHDYEAFQDFPDRILFLDPVSRSIRPVESEPDALKGVTNALETAAPPPPEVPPRHLGVGERVGRAWKRASQRALDTVWDAVSAVAAPVAWLRAANPIDGPRVRNAMRRHLAPGVAAFVGTSAILVAVTATYFLFERLPKREYAEALFLDDLLAGLGLILVRVAVPLLVTVLLAAKLGASTAAHLGHMSLTRQIDALRLLRVPLRRHLLLPAAAGQLAAAWVHTALALVLAYLASLVVFLWGHPGWSALYVRRVWFQELEPTDLIWLAAKVGVSALAVAAVAFRAGIAPKRAPGEVVTAIHDTLLRALLVVLVIHAIFAFLEFG
jgi:energy-coupling factor transporter ATP-binding protein EcfA2/ABC-type transporter Mla maintaining outer membrane lipid asymmetry permease subunit MlaE